MGYDLSPDAIELAKENARALDLDAGFHELDVFHPSAAEQVVQHSGGRVGVLVSNPPYIPLHEYRALPASVRSYEDPRALLGDPSGYEGDGLAFYRRIADLLPDVLRSEEEMDRDGLGGLPRVAVEIGAEQGKAVEEILRSSPGGVVHRTEVWVDQYDRDRAVVGWAC
jgi:methylase of polypeptide subunit release factors